MSLEFEIKLLKKIKELLIEYIYLKEDDQNYTNNPVTKSSSQLLDNINNRLSHFCSHHIIEDIIEIGMDKTKVVCYCEKCNVSFTHL